jgi:ABC-type lipoprotein release transport system permease subunit
MILLPVVFIVSAMTVGLLAAGNVRSRREEIGIFRALGFTTRQVLLIFLGKAALTGILGGVLAILIGSTALMLLTPPVSSDEAMSALDTRLMILKQPGMLVTLLSVPVIALLLAVLASTIPAILAAKQDAAKILQQE